MYISELRIKNYRNFGEKEFSMPLKQFTAIIGENNVGKSNLIDSIGLVISQDITMFKKRILDIEDINYKTKEAFKKQIAEYAFKEIDEKIDEILFPEVKVQIILDDMDEKQLSVVGDWFFEDSFTKAKLTYLFRIRPGFNKNEWIKNQVENLKIILEKKDVSKDTLYEYVDFPIEQYEYIIYGGESPSNKCDQYFLKMLKLEVLDALRDAKKQLVANGEYKLLYRILNQDYDTEFINIQSILEELNDEIQCNAKLSNVREDLTKYLDRISLTNPLEPNKIDFKFSSPEVSEILKRLSLIYGQEPISIERNGLGKNNLLYISLILSHLASRQDDRTKLIFRVIGVEEPEAHLHPHLQKHLASNLGNYDDSIENENEIKEKKKDTQIIITSHSTHVTTSIDLENLAVLYKEDGNVNYHYVLDGFKKDKKGKEHVRYLKKYLNATNSCMFYARKIILVEGISEQILIPTFFKNLYNQTLESIGCNIINVNGVAFKHFLEIIKNGYFIKCGVITDKDEGTHVENRASNLKKTYENDIIKVEFNNDTFEKAILRSNAFDEGKEILLNTFKKVRPNLSKKLCTKWEKEIDIDEYFMNIEEYKSEFAFTLEEEIKDKTTGFNVPLYIKNIFRFIMGENDE